MSQFLSQTAVSPLGEVAWQASRASRLAYRVSGQRRLCAGAGGRALSEALNQPDPLSINAFYLAPVALGGGRGGRGVALRDPQHPLCQCRSAAGGQLKLRATAAYTDLDQTQRPGLDQRGAARSAGLR